MNFGLSFWLFTTPEDLRGKLRLSEVTDRTLSEMLISGELDCVIAATPRHGKEGALYLPLHPGAERFLRECGHLT